MKAWRTFDIVDWKLMKGMPLLAVASRSQDFRVVKMLSRFSVESQSVLFLPSNVIPSKSFCTYHAASPLFRFLCEIGSLVEESSGGIHHVYPS